MRIKYKIVSLVIILTLLFANSITVLASNTASIDAYQSLITFCKSPWIQAGSIGAPTVGGNLASSYMRELEKKTYPVKDGGYLLYSEVVGATIASTDIIDLNKFNTLTTGSKQKFLEDLFKCANAFAFATEKGSSSIASVTYGANSETVGILYVTLEGKDGMGSVLMASIMENTKPDFASANRIYAPFSGLIGTILGLIAILIMALLGVTMALDIAYITVPAMRMALDAGGQNWHTVDMQTKQETNRFKVSNLVSQAARNAVLEEHGGAGVHEKNAGVNKHPLGVYFKYRWLELCVLGICLLYLVSGNIYSFVAWVLDLVSGFLGF